MAYSLHYLHTEFSLLYFHACTFSISWGYTSACITVVTINPSHTSTLLPMDAFLVTPLSLGRGIWFVIHKRIAEESLGSPWTGKKKSFYCHISSNTWNSKTHFHYQPPQSPQYSTYKMVTAEIDASVYYRHMQHAQSFSFFNEKL